MLLASLLLLAFLLFIMRPRTPRPISFIPSEEIKLPKKDLVKIDPSKIYLNDLFDTYKPPLPPVEEKYRPKPMPQPPTPRLVTMPMKPLPKFLEPLKISLKGVIIGNNEELNRAIIENVQEKTSKNYKVGDKLEDARLIRILRNKIILLRSNGQQETVYVNPRDAEIEAMLLPTYNWSTVVKKVNEGQYEVDPDGFIEKVQNLAQLIEILDLTTVYRKGKSIGCRIGKIEKSALAQALGFMRGDIILSINDIPTTTTKNRFAIYKMITAMNEGDLIKVQLTRKQIPVTITYTLKKFPDIAEPKPTSSLSKTLEPTLSPAEAQELLTHLDKQHKKYASVTQKLEKKEKQDMLKLSSHPLSARKRVQGALMDNINL